MQFCVSMYLCFASCDRVRTKMCTSCRFCFTAPSRNRNRIIVPERQRPRLPRSQSHHHPPSRNCSRQPVVAVRQFQPQLKVTVSLPSFSLSTKLPELQTPPKQTPSPSITSPLSPPRPQRSALHLPLPPIPVPCVIVFRN